MEIKITDFELKKIDYRILKPLQGNLKNLSPKNYERLKKSFSEKGLFVPIYVWQEGKEFWILDGHGREKLFSQEKVSFIDLLGKKSYEVPCLIIQADNLQDAKEKLLIISSQYQSLQPEGFEEFIDGLDETWLQETIHFDAFGEDQNFQLPESNQDIDEEAMKNTQHECPQCGFQW